MSALLGVSRAIDRLNQILGVVAIWLVLLACLVSAGNAAIRYALNGIIALGKGSPTIAELAAWYSVRANAFLEMQWYMFAGIVLLGGPLTLKLNEHVRVDLVFSSVSSRTRLWIDILGATLFLLPMCAVLIYFTWPWFLDAWKLQETSQNPGGLLRWPVKLLLPLGFGLMALQGISELIKRIAALNGVIPLDTTYEAPLQ